jgi:hypothetical protein
MQHINSNGFCIVLLELLLLEILLYSTALSYAKSIVFFRVHMFPSSYNIRERPLGALPNITNIKKKRTAAFNISSSIGFNLGLLLCLIPYYLPPASLLYQNFRVLLLYIGAV